MSWLFFVVLTFVILTAAALFMGIGSFVKGGAFNRKHGNRLMRFRVIFQFAAIILLALMFLLADRH
ncbi:MAG: twin transmembrane helix small protein [Rhodospirillales bacterium]|nr:twin transmembrane helix small protein [Rhodospirillales bacterium]